MKPIFEDWCVYCDEICFWNKNASEPFDCMVYYIKKVNYQPIPSMPFVISKMRNHESPFPLNPLKYLYQAHLQPLVIHDLLLLSKAYPEHIHITTCFYNQQLYKYNPHILLCIWLLKNMERFIYTRLFMILNSFLYIKRYTIVYYLRTVHRET